MGLKQSGIIPSPPLPSKVTMNHLSEWPGNDRSISDSAKSDVYAYVVARDFNVTRPHPFAIFLDKVIDDVPHSL